MANIEAIKCVGQLDGCMVIMYQVFIPDLILSFDLIADQLRVTIGLKIFHPHLLSKLEANEQSVVLCHIIGTRFR